jgi:hypothetical protein
MVRGTDFIQNNHYGSYFEFSQFIILKYSDFIQNGHYGLYFEFSQFIILKYSLEDYSRFTVVQTCKQHVTKECHHLQCEQTHCSNTVCKRKG